MIKVGSSTQISKQLQSYLILDIIYIWNMGMYGILGKGLAKIFRKEPESKYVGLYRSYGLFQQLILAVSAWKQPQTRQMKDVAVFQNSFIWKNRW